VRFAIVETPVPTLRYDVDEITGDVRPRAARRSFDQ
jgi:hypothetical protein